MEDLHLGLFSISPEYIKAHQTNFDADLDAFAHKTKGELKSLEIENKVVIDNYLFDSNTGRGHIEESKLSPAEKRLKEIVSKRFSFANFFVTEKGKIKNRNEIYYATFSEEPRSLQVIKLCMYLDTSLAILQGIKKEDFTSVNFVIATLFDDIRYKFILLYEDILDNDIDLPRATVEKLTAAAIVNYYNYLLGVPQLIIGHSQMIVFAKEARQFIIDYLKKFNKDLKPIRKYKEADIPMDNLLLISKLKRNLPEHGIDLIIGIRFGGIELPFLIKHYIFPNADIRQMKISKYSAEGGTSDQPLQQFVAENKVYLKTRNVLIVDDSITTARTAEVIINALRSKTRNIYFCCVYHPESKRIPHMKMPGHGGVNLEELKKCCVLKESNYTASANMTSYLGRNKKFDKTKEKIKERLKKNAVKNLKSTPSKEVVKDANTKKVFIASSQSAVTSGYNALIYIRNHFNSKKEFQILDDWIDGANKRIHIEERIPHYKEIDGRDFLSEALNDIGNSDLVVLYYPAPSTYLSLLFRIAELSNKEIWIFYSRQEDIKAFEGYSNERLIPIRQLKTQLA